MEDINTVTAIGHIQEAAVPGMPVNGSSMVMDGTGEKEDGTDNMQKTD